MRAKRVKELLEAGIDLTVSANTSLEDLIDGVKSADRMLKKGIEPLLHSKKDYKKYRKDALAALKKNHNLSKKDIKDKLDESINTRLFLNEAFDVLTWSRKHLPTEIADDIEETHEGGFGEKFQTSLLKILNKDELLKWYNKNFEVGIVNEYNEFRKGIDSKEALNIGLSGVEEFKEFLEKNGYSEYEQQEADTPDRKTIATFLPNWESGDRNYASPVYFKVYIDKNYSRLRVNYEDENEFFRDNFLSSILKRIRKNLMPEGKFKNK